MPHPLVVHCKRDSYDVLIDRSTKWGNPYTHLGTRTKASFKVATREESIECYKAYVLDNEGLMEALWELKGRVLGCWCAPRACHGDVLARLAEAIEQGYSGAQALDG